MLLLSPPNRRLATLLSTLALSIIGLGVIFLATSDAAGATPVRLSAHAAADSVAVRVRGAADIQSVGLYVDGHLRQRDTSRPWHFGRDGRIPVGIGRHHIVAVAKVGHHRFTSAKSVTVKGSGADDSGGSEPAGGGGSNSNGNSRDKETGTDRRDASEVPPSVGPAEAVAPPVEELAPQPPADESLDAGEIYFHGDYETGNLSQWEMIQRTEADRIQVVTSPTIEGKYAARFETRPTDFIGDTEPRSEVAAYLGEEEGQESWFRWYTYFPEAFPTQFPEDEYPEDFMTFTQWRAVDESSAYGSFMVYGDQLEYRRGGTLWETALTKNVWHKFVYHVKWSADPGVGFVELYYDGQLVLPKTYVATMAGTPGHGVENYVKQGYYKSSKLPTGYLYQDGFVAGTSFAAVNDAP